MKSIKSKSVDSIRFNESKKLDILKNTYTIKGKFPFYEKTEVTKYFYGAKSYDSLEDLVKENPHLFIVGENPAPIQQVADSLVGVYHTDKREVWCRASVSFNSFCGEIERVYFDTDDEAEKFFHAKERELELFKLYPSKKKTN